ncbi:MAG: preprotein translocase subunit YajC [Planctomycetes bacterium]|nr:preprotein translocase subunit YajC [Planctomycetota bacterium]
MLYLMVGVALMLFFSMRRESKARKAQQAMLSAIKQGDQVVTSSGIHGTVHRLEPKTVTLLLDSAKVTFERASIARIIRDEGAETA